MKADFILTLHESAENARPENAGPNDRGVWKMHDQKFGRGNLSTNVGQMVTLRNHQAINIP